MPKKTATKPKPHKKSLKELKSAAGNKLKSNEKVKKEEVMDRAMLKGIAGQLSRAGSRIKVLKSDSDEALQKKVNEAIQQLPEGEVLEKLESIDPGKLVTVLKRDCLGIFVDFSDVSCVRCADAPQCVRAFIDNLRGGMAVAKVAAAEARDEPGAKTKSLKLTPVTRYEPDRLVFVRDVPNPNPEGDDYHDTLRRVLDEQPENLKELREIVEQDFDVEGDGDFMKFVSTFRDPKEGVIKLDVDLSEADKRALRSAGYKV